MGFQRDKSIMTTSKVGFFRRGCDTLAETEDKRRKSYKGITLRELLPSWVRFN